MTGIPQLRGFSHSAQALLGSDRYLRFGKPTATMCSLPRREYTLKPPMVQTHPPG